MAKNIPWQDRPEGCKDIVWRYSENPVIDRYSIPSSNSIFNIQRINNDCFSFIFNIFFFNIK